MQKIACVLALVFSALFAVVPGAALAKGINGFTNDCKFEVFKNAGIDDAGARRLQAGWLIPVINKPLKTTIWAACREEVQAGTTFLATYAAPPAEKPAIPVAQPAAAKPAATVRAPVVNPVAVQPQPAVAAPVAVMETPPAPKPEPAPSTEPIPATAAPFTGNARNDAAIAADAAADAATPYVSPYEQTLRDSHYKDNSLQTRLIDFVHSILAWMQNNWLTLVISAIAIPALGVIAFLGVKFFPRKDDDLESAAHQADEDLEDAEDAPEDNLHRWVAPTPETSGLVFDNRPAFQRLKEGPLNEQAPFIDLASVFDVQMPTDSGKIRPGGNRAA